MAAVSARSLCGDGHGSGSVVRKKEEEVLLHQQLGLGLRIGLDEDQKEQIQTGAVAPLPLPLLQAWWLAAAVTIAAAASAAAAEARRRCDEIEESRVEKEPLCTTHLALHTVSLSVSFSLFFYQGYHYSSYFSLAIRHTSLDDLDFIQPLRFPYSGVPATFFIH